MGGCEVGGAGSSAGAAVEVVGCVVEVGALVSTSMSISPSVSMSTSGVGRGVRTVREAICVAMRAAEIEVTLGLCVRNVGKQRRAACVVTRAAGVCTCCVGVGVRRRVQEATWRAVSGADVRSDVGVGVGQMVQEATWETVREADVWSGGMGGVCV